MHHFYFIDNLILFRLRGFSVLWISLIRPLNWLNKARKKTMKNCERIANLALAGLHFFFPFCFVVTWSRSWLTVLRFSGLKRKNEFVNSKCACTTNKIKTKWVCINFKCMSTLDVGKKRIKSLIWGGGVKFCYISEFLFCCNWVCVSYMWSCLYYGRK